MFIRVTNLTPFELTAAIVREPLIVSPETTVIDAITQMSGVRTACSAFRANNQLEDIYIQARSSCVLVVADNQIVGILTERDIVRLVARKQQLATLLVGEVMSEQVITLQESEFTDLFSAVNILLQHHIRHLPIVNQDNRLTGLLTHESLQRMSRPINLLRLRSAAEVMTSEVVCAPPQTLMSEVAKLMTQHSVSSVVIVVQSESLQPLTVSIPVGIVTERDVVQFQALNLDLQSCPAAAVMSSPVFSVLPHDSLWAVQQIMEQQFIGRLVVRGSQNELLGIVTQSSLLQALNPLELYKLAEALEQKVLRLEAEKVELLENRAIELEQQVKERTAALKAKVDQEHLITTIATQIRSSLDLQTILDTTVAKLQAILNCDRVAIWQLQPDHQLLAVAESASSESFSQLGQRVYDPCFAPHWLMAYQRGRVRVVSDIYTANLTACHLTLLERLRTRAKVLLPVIDGNTLWGLLEATESDAPRQWQPEEVRLLERLATQLTIAIQQATAYQQVQVELTERRKTEARLRESEQRFATLAAAAPVGIFRTDVDGHCLYVNERWCRIAGLTAEEALGMGWMQGLHPSDQDSIAVEWYCAAQENRPFQLEYRFQRLDGTITWVFGQAVAERNLNQQITGYVGTITDITALKQAQDLLIHNALHDPLTNLPNRALLMERLELAMTRTRHTAAYHYAILFIDLDRFKIVNDSLGHLIGDRLLKTIAQKLKMHTREIDLVTRVGGDEFVILLEEVTGTEKIVQLAERILADCQTPFDLDEYQIFISLSIGIVLGAKTYCQASDIIRDADIAMYRAKASGGNSYKFFDAAMHIQVLQRLTLETSLRKALEREEFTVFYQPIVDILQHRLIGFEALVRWQHPEHGFIAPGSFIPIAEEIGLIAAIDTWVFQTACQQMADWQIRFPEQFPLKISLNLSAQDLCKPNLLEEIDRTLATTGLSGHSICLEVTESTLIRDVSQTIDLLTQLKLRDIQISIDDFGTGYSSLSYLHQLPADTLKIDRSFVSQMQIKNRNYQVVDTIVTLSNQLGLTVVAEGIETQQQLQWLQQLGCKLGQGYLFSKPLAAREIEAKFFKGSCVLQLSAQPKLSAGSLSV